MHGQSVENFAAFVFGQREALAAAWADGVLWVIDRVVENIAPAVWAIEIKNAEGANFIVHKSCSFLCFFFIIAKGREGCKAARHRTSKGENKMTRKRFAKLLMGRFLLDRDTAELIVRMAQLAHILCSDAPETVYKGAWDSLCE